MPMSNFLTFPKPVLASKGAICTTCLQQFPKLNKCGGCKRTSYCSQKCQKKDWSEGHRKFCRVFVEMNEHFSDNTGSRTWKEYRLQVWSIVDAFRSRCEENQILASNEARMLLYQPYCANCYRSQNQLPKEDKLKLCSTCNIAAYCRSCTLHDHSCLKLTSISKAELFSIHHYLQTGETSLGMPTEIPRSIYRPLSTANSWYDYFTSISDKRPLLSGKITSDLNPLSGSEQVSNVLIAATDKNTMILTIIAALEAVFSDLANKKSITLHIIGATAKELDALMLFEEILHLLPNLKSLHCSFIGPQLPMPIDGGRKTDLDCCPPCTNAARTRSMSMFKGPYHDYTQDPTFSLPDLGVVFHSGHSQEAQEEWRPSIEYLVTAEFPTVFTTFNEKEMREETEGLRGKGAGFVKEGERNRWMGERPLLDPLEEVEGSVYNNNQYWYIISGKKD
ncbi:hypothetical protein ONS95_009638 [Cadophora gregata]|uniref:uncharacterized protein n=1 Tax=Cadophora gregata TaxID=51156 RepID=UPI0026DD62CC|nr:uncharacterized protein ONS95_009638 [Cadophora gregata]KAK0124694.1 hypothetical protein ONS95_009638 [Cadophora gregata]KAK0129446.1 hypothetical protein ONS96_000018 [Cadophora gregata f. sp. sojae]